jgi:uncharacterized protein (TIGR02001 family)
MPSSKWLPALLLMAALPDPAAAQPAVDLSANAGLVSDYRFRGISLSDRRASLQGGVDLETGLGLFAGGWASTIADYEGADVEVDVYAGFQGSAATIDYRIGAYAYLYPGGADVNYVEFQAHAERALGPVKLGLETSLAPRQDNVRTANLYFGGSAAFEIPRTGVTVSARGGREDGFYDGKWDWEIGASYTRSALTASLAYVDSNQGGTAEAGRLGRGGLVASLTGNF